MILWGCSPWAVFFTPLCWFFETADTSFQVPTSLFLFWAIALLGEARTMAIATTKKIFRVIPPPCERRLIPEPRPVNQPTESAGQPPRSIGSINRALGPEGGRRLASTGGARWVTEAPLRLALARIAEDAILRFTADAKRLTRCKLPSCGALLLSSSRGERRRWCSMETCGNRAKV